MPRIIPSNNPFLDGDSSIRSLNQARIMTLPEAAADPEIIGKTGYDLLSAEALQQEITHFAAELNLQADAPHLLRQFDHCLQMKEKRALQIAQIYGRKLGALLLMLKRGDLVNRQSRPQWGLEHWRFWQQVTGVIIGGGVMAGRLGQLAAPVAQETLSRHAFPDFKVTRSPHAAHLPLVGLARKAPCCTKAMIVFDFGQTAIKRAIARYRDGEVAALQLLTTLPTVCRDLSFKKRPVDDVRRQWRQMRAVIEQTWREAAAGREKISDIRISLSCYLFDGHPSPRDHGCYGGLQVLAPNLDAFIQEELDRRLPYRVKIHLVHDGTAAATAHAGEVGRVVLTLGTAIGNGFPPPADSVCPLADDFQIL